MAHRISPKYVAALVAAAALMLVLGVLLKPQKHAAEPPSAEVPTLQRLTRGEGMRGLVSYQAERAAFAGRHVVRLEGREGSGVVWGQGGEAVTAADGARVLLPLQSVPAPPDRAPAPLATALPSAHVPVLIVGRRSDGSLAWAAATYQGQGEGRCGSTPVRQLAVAVPEGPEYDGAGVFLLDGLLAGVVGRCGAERVTVAASAIGALLEQWESTPNQLAERFGFVAVPLDEAARSYFKQADGLLVRSVWQDTPADTAGLRPGDIITLPELTNGDPLPLIVARGRRTYNLLLRAGGTETGALGLSATRDEGLQVRVSPASPAYRAGLRSGDHIVQIGERRPARAADLRRLEAGSDGAVWVVYRRGTQETGVLVTP